MNMILTSDEMKERYSSEWILIGNPETSDDLEVIRGEVLAHSKNRDDVYLAARTLQPRSSAILYTGEIPRDAAIVL